MLHTNPQYCTECLDVVAPSIGLDRRGFIRAAAGGAVGLMVGPSLLSATASSAVADDKVAGAKPAEGLVQELFATLTPEQKTALVLPWNHGAENGGTPSRLKTHRWSPAREGTRRAVHQAAAGSDPRHVQGDSLGRRSLRADHSAWQVGQRGFVCGQRDRHLRRPIRHRPILVGLRRASPDAPLRWQLPAEHGVWGPHVLRSLGQRA